ncbi:MAG: DUF4388 domain-containing protein [Deltaproteobacteria bacterium]|nr:DUF4388 domain-containing protein [Deltaproteobacteria bacterium]
MSAAPMSNSPSEDGLFTAVEYLQMASLGSRSMIVSIDNGNGTVGEIVMRDGEPWCAKDRLGHGEAAFLRLVAADSFSGGCHATVRGLRGPLAPRNLDGSLEHLLLEAARTWDEAQPRPAERPDSKARLRLDSFESLLEAGIDALLSKSFNDAYAAFSAAEAVRAGDRVVQGNLRRLRDLGYGDDGER